MKHDIDSLIAEMSLAEKASLCSGNDFWHTKPIARLGIPSVMMSDGPHGLRKQAAQPSEVALTGVPATCFPSGAALAASWDRDLIARVATAIAHEAVAEGVSIVLGPAVNIKRSPLCGRNFEYLSEDPYLASEMAKAHIAGLQTNSVGASIKHFAANNQERLRMTINAQVDERTLREIYLCAFEGAIVNSQPWTVMCAYNRLNGEYCSEHSWLLTEVLKKEWGHTGIVVTDWGACNNRVDGLVAGQELEMPGNGGMNDAEIVRAVEEGRLDEQVLDGAVRRLLELVDRCENARKNVGDGAKADLRTHHLLARKVAAECMVLLKNDADTLPLPRVGKIAFIGEFAEKPRYQGGGSSHITPTQIDSALSEARKLLGTEAEVVFASGYHVASDAPDDALIAEAAQVARDADVAVVFVGLSDRIESEGFDRPHMRMPESHSELLKAVFSAQVNVVVVLSNGAPIEMPWVQRPRAIVESYLGGQAWGGAVVDVLFGVENPSGKLAETFPVRLEDNPSFLDFPGDGTVVRYGEGVFVGYRYYDRKRIEPLFPFGHGLSYTTFKYSDLHLSSHRIRDIDEVSVTVRVQNTGSMKGREVVQLYVEDAESSVPRPPRELKGFTKVELAPGESKVVSFTLNKRSFAFWDEEISNWRVESGDFYIHTGSSSRDIRQTSAIYVESTTEIRRRYGMNTTTSQLAQSDRGKAFAEELVSSALAAMGNPDPDSPQGLLFCSMLSEMPLRNMIRMFSSKREEIEQVLEELNH